MKRNFAVLILLVVGVFAYGVTHSPAQPGIQIQAANNAIQANQTDSEKPRCNPNYSGCLKPDASDYDCIGGSGNGPYYTGRVRVIGYDQYGLDRDGDGWGCDNN